MKLAVGSDHAAYEFKMDLLKYLEEKGIEYEDLGSHSAERTDYPIWGEKVARKVAAGEVDAGLLFCGTGVGISISANKVRGIRAVVCSEPYSAAMARRHNNANILCMGARVVGPDLARMILDAFLHSEFEGGRHAKRVDLISAIEAREER
ncbi:Ribose 5-phosphate isomerase B [Clostridiaceae bacterium JG1575]|nr:Ribose 5-phosphate isomerase B [Clostridiaceae bacterium JG1575]